MRKYRLPQLLFFSALMFFSAPGFSRERDRVAGDFERGDGDGDGKLDRVLC